MGHFFVFQFQIGFQHVLYESFYLHWIFPIKGIVNSNQFSNINIIKKEKKLISVLIKLNNFK